MHLRNDVRCFLLRLLLPFRDHNSAAPQTSFGGPYINLAAAELRRLVRGRLSCSTAQIIITSIVSRQTNPAQRAGPPEWTSSSLERRFSTVITGDVQVESGGPGVCHC